MLPVGLYQFTQDVEWDVCHHKNALIAENGGMAIDALMLLMTGCRPPTSVFSLNLSIILAISFSLS